MSGCLFGPAFRRREIRPAVAGFFIASLFDTLKRVEVVEGSEEYAPEQAEIPRWGVSQQEDVSESSRPREVVQQH